jgi:hypothetical protein
MEREPTKSWTTSAYDRVDREWVHTLNHSYDHTAEQEPISFITQAPPLKITSSKAKGVKRDTIDFGVIPDEQIGYRNIGGEYVPMHDERAMKAARMMLKDMQPDYLVAVGDTIDMPELSRFAPDSDHFFRTMQPAIDRASLWDAELAADNPTSTRIRLAGNHQRLNKFILKNAMQLYGLKRAGEIEPILSIPYLVRAEETGWTYIEGYPANEFRPRVGNNNLVFVHGNKVRSGGSTAELMSKTYPERHVFFGHVHRHESHTRTNYLGEYLTAETFGTLARIDGIVPSYGNGVTDKGEVVPRYENWQQGIGKVSVHKSGEVTTQFLPIRNGVGYYNGKEYK